MPPVSLGDPGTGAGGAGTLHYTRIYLQQSQFVSPPAAVSVEKCQDSLQEGNNHGWEPWGPADPSTCTPRLTAVHGEHMSGLCPRLVSPYVLQVKNTRKNLD